MSRIRSIKPDFWSSEQVMSVSVGARLLFIGIWNFSDDAGRFRWKPATLKAQVFPGDVMENTQITGWLAELSGVGLLQSYSVLGEDYGRVTGWHHQAIKNPSRSKYPEPPDNQNSTPALPQPYPGPTEGLGHGSSPLLSSPLGSSPKEDLREDASLTAAPSVSVKIAELESRYAHGKAQEARQACAMSRRNGKMSDSRWLAVLERLEKHPAGNVERAMETFCERYADGQKDERYLEGIVRGESRPRPSQGLSGKPISESTARYLQEAEEHRKNGTLFR